MKGISVKTYGIKTVFGPPTEDGEAMLIVSIGKEELHFRIEARSSDHQNGLTYD